MDVDPEQPSRLCRTVGCVGGWPRVMAWAATITIVVLAMVEGGSFDAGLAVTTATAVAVVWYAYWTFRVARPKAWVSLEIHPEELVIAPDRNRPALRPTVINQVPRQLHTRVTVRVWVDGEPVRLEGPLYRGKEPYPVDRRLSPAGVLPLTDHLEWTDDGFVNDELLIMFEARWIDTLCERGQAKKFWRVDLTTGQPDAIISATRRRRLFGPLPDPYTSDDHTGADG